MPRQSRRQLSWRAWGASHIAKASTFMSTVLLMSCPDQPGAVAAVTTWIFEQGGDILYPEQHGGIHADTQLRVPARCW